MTLRVYNPEDPVNTYSASSELDYVIGKLCEILYFIGKSESDLETITIDEIIAGIRETAPFTKSSMQDGVYVATAANTELNALTIKLVSSARRHWYRYHIAKGADNNA